MAVAVATTAVVVSGLQGFRQYARISSTRAFGSDSYLLAQVIPGPWSRRELAERLQRNPVIRRSDVRFLERSTSAEVLYAPVIQSRGEVVAGSRKLEGVAINGTSPELFAIRDLGIREGRFFGEAEARNGAQVAVIGAEVADLVLPGQDPLGRLVRLGGRGFRVIGVQSRQGTGGGVSLDRYVWIPLKAFERTFGAPASLQVFARARDPERTERAEALTRTAMRSRRHLGPARPDNFDLLSPEAARGFVLQLSERIGAAVGPVSLLALLAAVVVVTNTSLVSVTQRTREIGVRRAVGATRRRVVMEVLAESTLISLVGGVLGLLLAEALLAVLSSVLDFAVELGQSTLVLGLLAAALAGLAAGFYPARRASRIEVVNALRLE
jgi:putative ABC transport system permease protein